MNPQTFLYVEPNSGCCIIARRSNFMDAWMAKRIVDLYRADSLKKAAQFIQKYRKTA
jgi:hypothetical protein